MSIIYKDFWPGFNPRYFIMDSILNNQSKNIKVIGPYFKKNIPVLINKIVSETLYRADLFITAENRSPQWLRARYQIGFWKKSNGNNCFRFPYWKYYVNYEGFENKQDSSRFGELYSIDQLMRPISESYSRKSIEQRIQKACFFTRHLVPPRDKFYYMTSSILGCDGFGPIFDGKRFVTKTKTIRKNYLFNLCPENSIGDGYITEKIPEAFLSGCIPIAWCRPEDLELDFNPNAVVNLYGLNQDEISEKLSQLKDPEIRKLYYNEPLVISKPKIDELIDYIG